MTPRERAVRQVRLELASRKLIVNMLGVMAALIGVGMALSGAPAFLEALFSPWSRMVFAGLIFFPGVAVACGGALGDETRIGWLLQVFGLAQIAIWCLLMSIAHAILFVSIGYGWVAPGQPLTEPTIAGRAYVPLFYFCIFLVTSIPMVTMLRVGRPVLAKRADTIATANKGSQ